MLLPTFISILTMSSVPNSTAASTSREGLEGPHVVRINHRFSPLLLHGLCPPPTVAAGLFPNVLTCKVKICPKSWVRATAEHLPPPEDDDIFECVPTCSHIS
jgi:hypothetical protein